MLKSKVPSKVIIYYDLLSDGFLIRVIDENWVDIIKYDTLPVLCKMSDLFVEVVKVDNFDYKNDNTLDVNSVLSFNVEENGNVNVDANTNEKNIINIRDYIKSIFNVNRLCPPM